MNSLKKNVTKYFKARNLLLKSMGGKAVSRSDDMFELFVLAEILGNVDSKTKVVPQCLMPVGNSRVYIVACAPSPSWAEASHVQVTTSTGKMFGLRTGLEVGLSNHTTAELDLVIVDSSTVPNQQGGVVAASVVAACECKAFAKTLQMSTIEQVLGKSMRVWGYASTTAHLATNLYRFTLCSLSKTSTNPRIALKSGGVGLVDDILKVQINLSNYASSLCVALGI